MTDHQNAFEKNLLLVMHALTCAGQKHICGAARDSRREHGQPCTVVHALSLVGCLWTRWFTFEPTVQIIWLESSRVQAWQPVVGI